MNELGVLQSGKKSSRLAVPSTSREVICDEINK